MSQNRGSEQREEENTRPLGEVLEEILPPLLEPHVQESSKKSEREERVRVLHEWAVDLSLRNLERILFLAKRLFPTLSPRQLMEVSQTVLRMVRSI